MIKKTILAALLALFSFVLAVSCTNPSQITVVSREDGSGTRGAFVELLDIEIKEANGNKKDWTTKDAIITNKTDVMLTNVSSDPNAIGYVSMGSLNHSVKALSIEGVAPTAENVQNGTYPISRPFNIATKGHPEGITKDFIQFILSAEGQSIAANGYIPVDGTPTPYDGNKPTGKLVIAGSSSVTPVMEKLVEAYQAINPGATIEIQMSDSTSGMTGTIDGIYHIGMASRSLKESEEKELMSQTIALDGIAVIVNPKNPVNQLTREEVRSIYRGDIITWEYPYGQ